MAGATSVGATAPQPEPLLGRRDPRRPRPGKTPARRSSYRGGSVHVPGAVLGLRASARCPAPFACSSVRSDIMQAPIIAGSWPQSHGEVLTEPGHFSASSTTVLKSISRSPVRVHTSDRADGAATRGRGGHTPWRSRWGHAVQAAPGAPRGLKRLGRRGAGRKARGAGGESLARSAARKA